MIIVVCDNGGHAVINRLQQAKGLPGFNNLLKDSRILNPAGPLHVDFAAHAAAMKGAFTVPGDGALDFETIVKRCASNGYEGWFVAGAEQDPKVSPPLEMAQKGHKELLRVMSAAGYEVVQ